MNLILDSLQIENVINRLVDEKEEVELEIKNKRHQSYVLQVPDHRLLTKKEEAFLSYAIQNIKELKKEAIDLLIFFNMRLVISFAKDYNQKTQNHNDVDELFQEGIIGLITAVESYDYTQNTRFSTYASYWVKQAMGRYIETTSGSFRIPSHIHSLRRQIVKAIKALEDDSKTVTDETVLQYIKHNFDGDLTKKTFDAVYNKSNVAISLNSAVKSNVDTESIDYLDSIEDPTQNIDEIVIKTEQEKYIHNLLSVLKPIERDVIILTYGLFGIGGDLSLKEIAKMTHISINSVKYYKAKAFEKLKKHSDIFLE